MQPHISCGGRTLHVGRLPIFVPILVIWLIGARSVNADPQLAPRIPHTPLLITIRHGQDFTGDIWAWGGSGLVPRTGSGLCFASAVSPAGDSFVYLQIPADYAKHSASNGDRPAPRDLYLTNLATGRTVAIATQPKNASF